MKRNYIAATALITVAMLCVETKAHAYLDPGTGSFVLQIMLAGLPGILWLWALIDVLKSEFTGINKLVWLIAIMIPLIGPILYLFIGADQKIKNSEK